MLTNDIRDERYNLKVNDSSAAFLQLITNYSRVVLSSVHQRNEKKNAATLSKFPRNVGE